VPEARMSKRKTKGNKKAVSFFKFKQDFKDVSLGDLIKECKISNKEAKDILDYVNGKEVNKEISAIDLQIKEKKKIITLCYDMDLNLSSGIE